MKEPQKNQTSSIIYITNTARKIPVAAMEITTVGKSENRIIAKKVIMTAKQFAKSPDKMTGAIMEISTQPGTLPVLWWG